MGGVRFELTKLQRVPGLQPGAARHLRRPPVEKREPGPRLYSGSCVDRAGLPRVSSRSESEPGVGRGCDSEDRGRLSSQTNEGLPVERPAAVGAVVHPVPVLGPQDRRTAAARRTFGSARAAHGHTCSEASFTPRRLAISRRTARSLSATLPSLSAMSRAQR